MSVVRVEGVSKRYELGEPSSTLKRAASLWLARKPALDWVWALRDVSFSVGAGETVGLIGHNGAGKSTMLRLLSCISRPTEGKVETHGRIAALIALGAGFHPDLTGRENILLNGTVLGLRREEIHRRFDEIVAFSELERFLDTPVRHYSSGMSLRLSFSVAAILSCDILLVDEVLAVGDERFAEKCLTRMRQMRDEGTTIILASHDLWTVASFCSRAILFRQGRIQEDGPPEQVVESYQEELKAPESGGAEAADAVQLRVTTAEPSEAGELLVTIEFDTARTIEEGAFLLSVRRRDGLVCCGADNRVEMEQHQSRIAGRGALEVRLRGLRLVPGQYTADVQVVERGSSVVYGQSGGHLFTIHGEGHEGAGVVEVDAEWSGLREA